MLYVITNILWDVDDKKDLDYLPHSIQVEVDDLLTGDELEETLSEYLSDKYGFCHKGFEFKEYEPPKENTIKGDYYLVVEEWNYPTESGRDVSTHTFDNLENALNFAHLTIISEVDNFAKNTSSDIHNTEMFDDNSGYFVKTDDFYYAVRIIGVDKLW